MNAQSKAQLTNSTLLQAAKSKALRLAVGLSTSHMVFKFHDEYKVTPHIPGVPCVVAYNQTGKLI